MTVSCAARVYVYVRSALQRDGVAPTMRQIAADCHISTTSLVSLALDDLVAKGLLERGGKYQSRTLSLPQRARKQRRALEKRAADWQRKGMMLRWYQGADGQPTGFEAWDVGKRVAVVRIEEAAL